MNRCTGFYYKTASRFQSIASKETLHSVESPRREVGPLGDDTISGLVHYSHFLDSIAQPGTTYVHMRNLTAEAGSFEVVLHRPEIPPNTGSVARLCACTGSRLHLIAPLGFSLDDSKLKRAGLDYWSHVYVATHASLDDVLLELPGRGLHLFTGKAKRTIWETRFSPGDLLVFGSESVGLPDQLLNAHREHAVAIPMLKDRRSLNLASAVAVAVYEGLRQRAFQDEAHLASRGFDRTRT